MDGTLKRRISNKKIYIISIEIDIGRVFYQNNKVKKKSKSCRLEHKVRACEDVSLLG